MDGIYVEVPLRQDRRQWGGPQLRQHRVQPQPRHHRVRALRLTPSGSSYDRITNRSGSNISCRDCLQLISARIAAPFLLTPFPVLAAGLLYLLYLSSAVPSGVFFQSTNTAIEITPMKCTWFRSVDVVRSTICPRRILGPTSSK